jgi:hypothetical protein
MGRKCEICSHPQREAIDSVLATGTAPFRAVSRQYQCSKDSLQRHAASHLPRSLIVAQQRADDARARDLGALLDEAVAAARAVSQNHLKSRELARIIQLLVNARAAAANEQRPQVVDEEEVVQRWIDRLPDGVRAMFAAEVARQKEAHHRALVAEAEGRMISMVLSLDDGAAREAVFHHDGIRAQCSCGRWLRFVNARPLVEDVCEDCRRVMQEH